MDFTEDPFKDYRYEDTFNIEDPFDDDDNAEESNHATSKTVNDPFAPADVTIVTNKAFSSDRKNNNTSTISGRTSDQSDIAWFAFDESNCNENGRKSSEFYS